mmetsp:Transcript_59067/g.121041  ORF Transcript_59067/g.121041 Transcript_59067/m.121041 type:complete len:202 (+) Transcript_59067:207-812(+)
MAGLDLMDGDLDALSMLLSAPNKAAVNDLFEMAFNTRLDTPTVSQIQTAAELIGGASAAQTKAVLQSIKRTILRCAYPASIDAPGVFKLLPEGLDDKLAKLITQIVCHHLPAWREALIATQVSGARLLDMDWRVDIKTSSDSLARMAVPTCLLELQVQEAASRVGEMGGVETLSLELNKEALATMLEGLNKIRSQLSDVAQ